MPATNMTVADLSLVFREMGVPCHPGATNDEITSLEEALGVALPEDIVALYRDHNGMGERVYEDEEWEDDEDFTPVQFFRFMTRISVPPEDWLTPLPGKIACFWTDDESNNLFFHLDGPLVGRVGLLMHDDKSYPVLFSSLRSFLDAQVQAGKNGFPHREILGDYPPQQETISPDNEKAFVVQLQEKLPTLTDSQERRGAAQLIGLLLPWEQSETLLPLLDDHDFFIAEDACESLGKRRYAPAIFALRRAMDVDRPNVSGAVLVALCQIATPEAVAALLDAYSHRPAHLETYRFAPASSPYMLAEAMVTAGYRFRKVSPKPEYQASGSETWHTFPLPCPNRVLNPV
jgi:hypothetical protein